MSINFTELSELIKNSSEAGVESLEIDGDKVKVTFASNKKIEIVNPPVPEELQGPIEITGSLAEKIAEIHRQEEELNKMIEHPEDYEEELARLEEHELEDIPADGEGDS